MLRIFYPCRSWSCTLSVELPWSHFSRFLWDLRLPKEEEPKVWVIFTHGYHSHCFFCSAHHDGSRDMIQGMIMRRMLVQSMQPHLFLLLLSPGLPSVNYFPTHPKLLLFFPHWLTQSPYPDTDHSYHPSVSLFSLMANTRLWPLHPSPPPLHTHIHVPGLPFFSPLLPSSPLPPSPYTHIHTHTPSLPSVSLALPPVGWHKTVEQLTHKTTVCAWLNTVVIL